MSGFKYDKKKNGQQLELVFSGTIDEDADFPLLGEELEGLQQIAIDLDGVKSINSVGIRMWLDWIEPAVNKNVPMRFIKVPTAIVLQFNTVKGFFPAGAKVESAYVPFYCEKCDRDLKALIKLSDVEPGSLPTIDTQTVRQSHCESDKASCELEPEYSEKKYFTFLNS